ncbi:MAG: GntR family transcriptional regulator [bacterium]
MFVPLDRESQVPLPRQISAYLEELIRRGHLPPGAALPATRTLARDLGVNRKTTEAAYDELAARRLVDVRAGQGVTVRRRLPDNPELDLPFRPSRAGDPLPAESWAALGPPPPARVDFAGLGPGPSTVPARTLRRAVAEVLAERRTPLFGPPPSLGEISLRRAAARHLARLGVLRGAEDTAIRATRAEAVAAVLRSVDAVGRDVLVAGPLDPDLGRPLRAARCRISQVPENVAEAIRDRPPRLLLVPSGHSRLPGDSPDPARRRALLDLARRFSVPVLEDVTALDESPPPLLAPLATLDPSGRVLVVCDLSDEAGGEFSAAVIAGPPRAIERWRVDPESSPTSRLAQHALARILDAPRRARAREALRERRRLLTPALRRTIRRRLAELAGFTFGDAHDAVRLELPEDVRATELARLARESGIDVIVPADCGWPESREDFVLLDLTRHEEGDLLDGLRRLGQVFDAIDAHST